LDRDVGTSVPAAEEVPVTEFTDADPNGCTQSVVDPHVSTLSVVDPNGGAASVNSAEDHHSNECGQGTAWYAECSSRLLLSSNVM
jgi:hypothetical protein